MISPLNPYLLSTDTMSNRDLQTYAIKTAFTPELESAMMEMMVATRLKRKPVSPVNKKNDDVRI